MSGFLVLPGSTGNGLKSPDDAVYNPSSTPIWEARIRLSMPSFTAPSEIQNIFIKYDASGIIFDITTGGLMRTQNGLIGAQQASVAIPASPNEIVNLRWIYDPDNGANSVYDWQIATDGDNQNWGTWTPIGTQKTAGQTTVTDAANDLEIGHRTSQGAARNLEAHLYRAEVLIDSVSQFDAQVYNVIPDENNQFIESGPSGFLVTISGAGAEVVVDGGDAVLMGVG